MTSTFGLWLWHATTTTQCLSLTCCTPREKLAVYSMYSKFSIRLGIKCGLLYRKLESQSPSEALVSFWSHFQCGRTGQLYWQLSSSAPATKTIIEARSASEKPYDRTGRIHDWAWQWNDMKWLDGWNCVCVFFPFSQIETAAGLNFPGENPPACHPREQSPYKANPQLMKLPSKPWWGCASLVKPDHS